MAGVSKIQYKGNEIIYISFLGMDDKQTIQTLIHAEDLIMLHKNEVLILANATGLFGTHHFLKRANESGKRIKRYIKKSSIIGLTGAKKILLMGYVTLTGIDFKAFNTKEEALDYLVK